MTENVRAMAAGDGGDAAELVAFAEFLLEGGEGRHQQDESLGQDFMKIQSDMLIPNPQPGADDGDDDEAIMPGAIPRGLRRMIDSVYADVNNPEVATDEYFGGWAILTTTNAMVHRINEAVAHRLQEVAHDFLSADSEEDDDNGMFEQEVLHSFQIPPRQLTLKKGSPVITTRNLNPNHGLCDGTRLRVLELKPHVIHATITTEGRRGLLVLSPRILFISGDTANDYPFRLRRKQFPLQPAFAMTVNKAQYQTVSNRGLCLYSPCVSHRQLYVAMSRVTARSKFIANIEYPEKEEADGIYTNNIMYRQIFEKQYQEVLW